MDSVPPPTVPTPTVSWQPDRSAKTVPWPTPPTPTAMLRGLKGKCPACGETKLFAGYLKVVDTCSNCNAPLGSVRADDAPPYFTILIVAHIVVGAMVAVDRAFAPSDLTQTLIWVPVTIALCLGLLRPIKGATVGLMLKLGLFKSADDA